MLTILVLKNNGLKMLINNTKRIIDFLMTKAISMKKNNFSNLCIYALFGLMFTSCSKNFQKEAMPRKELSVVNQTTVAIRTFYVSSSTGNDTNDGLSTSSPWKTFKKVSSMTYLPGDAILFKAGDTWSSDNDTTLLRPKGSGSATNPIVIDKYGSGANPVFSLTRYPNSSGGVYGVVMMGNQSYWQINNLSINANNATVLNTLTQNNTTQASIAGIYFKNTNSTVQSNISISNCSVKSTSINGQLYTQAILGIGFEGAYNNVVVDGCTVDSCLAGIHSNVNLHFINPSSSSYQSSNITFKNNLLRGVWGNGIVIGSITNGLIDHNRVIGTSCGNGACIWLTGSKNSVVQYNEVSDQKNGSQDGLAFDDDDDEGTSNGDIFQYNYSHNNSHGFIMFMPSVQNVIVRFNISVNDGWSTGTTSRLLAFSPTGNNSGVSIYNNVFYTGQGITTRVIGTYGGSGSGWALNMYNNIFYVDGGTISAFSESALNQNSQFKNNCYFPSNKFTSASNYFTTQTNVITSDPLFKGEAAIGSSFGTNIISTSTNTIDFSKAITNFALQSSSPCINTGYNVTGNSAVYDFANNNIVGQTPNIGAIWTTNGTTSTYYTIKNRNTGEYLNLQNNIGKVECTQISPDSTSAQWYEELHNGYTRFKNKKTGQYMEEQNNLAYEEYNFLIGSDQWSCDYSLVANGSYTRLQNRYTNKIVNNQNNYGYAQATASLPIGYWSGDWTIETH
ncbi:MAG: hypothetical protein DI598_04780 [Pseudopedobacter saltans]|uniref:Ricin B lectin domain-containing protein n=1 Tax=Pseudopedobacter saltans TaxID=151895 RepID=A0A2W5HAM7_9SPHI|nr:MAG: hypothetical protein DI598_04780 [Pseudopedobacter saltans]